MTTLALFRHAKAVKQDPAGDHGRALAPAGRDAAAMMGARLRALLPVDALVLASDAKRTRETAMLAFPDHPSALLELDAELYAASASTLLAALRRIDGGTTAAVLVGHNPGLSDLALALAGPQGAAALADGLATADAVMFDVSTGWLTLDPNSVRLTKVLRREGNQD